MRKRLLCSLKTGKCSELLALQRLAHRGKFIIFHPLKKEKASEKPNPILENMTTEKPNLKNFSDTELQAELLRRSKCQFGRPSCAGYGEY